MSQKFITNKTPHITVVECLGDLVVRSWAETAVSVHGGNFNADETDSQISITSQSGLKLMLPEGSHLAVQSVSGDVVIKYVAGDISLHEVHRDAVLVGLQQVKIGTIHNDLSIKNVDGTLSVEQINGDASIRHVNDVNLGAVHGDVSARFINGRFQLQEAMGDISLRTVNGQVTIENGHRDINLRNLGSQVTVAQTQGDIRLSGGLSADDHTLNADRDIIVRWPLNAPLNVTAHAPTIKSRLPLEKVVEDEGSLIGRLGDGETNLTLTANGRIILKEDQLVDSRWEGDADPSDFDFSFDIEGLGAQISSQLLNQVSRITTDLESKFGPEFSQKISEKIAIKVEQAAGKAEQAAARAAERAERAAERARQRADYGIRRSPGRPPGTSKAAEPANPNTSEEQLKILKMVEKGIISPDEAATLLEALQ